MIELHWKRGGGGGRVVYRLPEAPKTGVPEAPKTGGSVEPLLFFF